MCYLALLLQPELDEGISRYLVNQSIPGAEVNLAASHVRAPQVYRSSVGITSIDRVKSTSRVKTPDLFSRIRMKSAQHTVEGWSEDNIARDRGRRRESTITTIDDRLTIGLKAIRRGIDFPARFACLYIQRMQ